MGFIGNYLRNLGSVALGRQPVRPLLFSYYITHRCELNCRYCCDGDGRRFKEDPIPELSTAEVRDLIAILAVAADTLDITGGEPMLRDDLEEILACARDAGLRTILNTKGIGLDTRPELLRHTDVLVLSLDTLDPAGLARLTGRSPQTGQRILDAVRFAVSKGREAGTRLVLSAVATPTNLEDVAKVLRFALDSGLGFHLSPEIVGRSANPRLPGNARYEELIQAVLSAKWKRRGVLGLPEYLRGIRDFSPFRCYPLLMPVVRPDGRMYYPCLESKRAEISLLAAGSYQAALDAARKRRGDVPQCHACCHIFCHMALSLFQRHPLSALGELKHWRN